MSNYSVSAIELRKFLKQPYSRANWINLFSEIFLNIEMGSNPPQLSPGWDSDFKNCTWVGKIKVVDEKSRERVIWVIELKLKEHNRLMAKVALRKGLSKLLGAGSIDCVLAFFSSDKDDSNYRMTFASAEWDFVDGKLQKTETPFKRFSFVLGKDEPCTTASQRIYQLAQKKSSSRYEDVVGAFSVEKLNKDFFDGYIDQYRKILYAVAQKNIRSFFNQDLPDSLDALIQDVEYKSIRGFVKRFMGRVVFLYFVQKKGWLGADKDNKLSIYENGNLEFIRELFNMLESDNGYEPFQYLFFDLLNNDRTEFNDICQMMDSKVPYLNSGLFEPESIVEGKRIAPLEQHKKIVIPRSSVDDYLNFLDQFNFTVDENSPTEGDIGIDPEMLGHIFENLLEDNRNKGAFYTPKTIVEFMAKKSLLAYLVNKICPSEEERVQLTNFVLGPPSIRPRPSLKLSKIVLELIKHVKVCDPAVGSGAFPMGILHEILWMLIDLGDERKTHEIKRDIISNSLRGVDLDGNAIEIARLRFWLSLIVDATKPQPLPNLDFTLIQGNSLVGVGIGSDLDKLVAIRRVGKERIKKVQDQLDLVLNEDSPSNAIVIFDLLTKFYNSHGEKKEKLLSQIHDLEISFLNEIKEEGKKLITAEKRRANSLSRLTAEKIQLLEESLARLETESGEKGYFLWHWYFGDILENGGFDIVIGNPPYVKEFTHKKAFDGVRESPYYQGKMDLWYLFACSTLDHLNITSGVLCLIATNNWTTNSGASILRKNIASRCTLDELIDFGDYKIFGGADIQTMIILLSNHASSSEYKFNLRRFSKKNPNDIDLLNLLQGAQNNSIEFLNPTFSRQAFLNKTFTFSNEGRSDLLKSIKSKANFLINSKTEIAQGIVPNPDVVSTQSLRKYSDYDLHKLEIERGSPVFVIPRDHLKNLSQSDKSFIKPCFEPVDVDRYTFKNRNRLELIYSTNARPIEQGSEIFHHLLPYKRIMDERRETLTGRIPWNCLHWPRDESFFIAGPKILSVRKCARPIFTYTEDEAYVMMSFNIIRPKGINLKYLAALYNSAITEFWLRNMGKLQGSQFQIDKEPILDIPIYAPTNDIQLIFAGLVDILIALKSNKIHDVAALFDDVLNLMVIQLYFPEHFVNNGVNLYATVASSEIMTLAAMSPKEICFSAPQVANAFFLSDGLLKDSIKQSFDLPIVKELLSA
jgi:adenine-specific DNA-methyltransferase